MNCIVCGGDHAPRAENCDSEGMDRQTEKLGARRWNALTAHVSKVNNKAGPMVPWELECQQEICTAPECECPLARHRDCKLTDDSRRELAGSVKQNPRRTDR